MPLKTQGSTYRVETHEKRSIPGPVPYSETTASWVIKPVKAEMIDGEWVATILLIAQEITVELPRYEVHGVSLGGSKISRKRSMRAFLQDSDEADEPIPSSPSVEAGSPSP